MALEPIQLRVTPHPASVVMVRQGSTTLNDTKLTKSCEQAYTKWGFFGFSVHSLPEGGFAELARLNPILQQRSRVLLAESSELLADGFPLLPTGPHPHWSVVLSAPTKAQFSRVRRHFVERANPSYVPRTR